nr:MAG TPA: hypothetical protein [Caudoviricetes sp.]
MKEIYSINTTFQISTRIALKSILTNFLNQPIHSYT